MLQRSFSMAVYQLIADEIKVENEFIFFEHIINPADVLSAKGLNPNFRT